MRRVVDCVVRRSQPGAGEIPIRTLILPSPGGEGGRRPGEGPGISNNHRQANRPTAGPGQELQDFENTSHAAHDDTSGEDALPSAPFPSVPERFLFSGRTGHPPRRLGWSPVFPGNFGKEMGRIETRFLENPPKGPRRRQPCGNWSDTQNASEVRTFPMPPFWRFVQVWTCAPYRGKGPPLSHRDHASPYWYIRGVTPHSLIRRW
jgi:hypothetical protein